MAASSPLFRSRERERAAQGQARLLAAQADYVGLGHEEVRFKTDPDALWGEGLPPLHNLRNPI
jgi:hypothetical protein